MLQRLAAGRCRAGTAKRELTPGQKSPMAGYSLAGSWGKAGTDSLWARVLYLQDLQTGEEVAFCFLDLMSGSRLLLEHIHQALRERQHPELVGKVVLSGTHTHTAPGLFYGNRFYDLFAQPWRRWWLPRWWPDRRWVQSITEQTTLAIVEAQQQAQDADVFVHQVQVWGACRNRSYPAYQAAEDEPGAPLGFAAPLELSPEQRAIDPRLTVISARAQGKLIASFASFGCHATALGPPWAAFARDWPGFAVDCAEQGPESCLAALAALAAGNAGDVTPLPSSPSSNASAGALPKQQGEELARHVGRLVGERWQKVLRAALTAPECSAALPLTVHQGLFKVPPREGLTRWQIGVPALGGSEDGGPFAKPWAFIAEGFQGSRGPQRPKAPALGPFQSALVPWLLDIAPYHPWHRVRLGDHLFLTVPGEPTTMAGRTLERALLHRFGAASASTLGYTGDYAGYFTTWAEYQVQHYEGASTLYGPNSLSWLEEQLQGPPLPLPARREPLTPPSTPVPMRETQRLLEQAFQLDAPPGKLQLLFAWPATGSGPALRVSLRPRANKQGLATAQAARTGLVRPYPHPDLHGAPEMATFIASFDRSGGSGSTHDDSRDEEPGLPPLSDLELQVSDASSGKDGARTLSLVSAAQAAAQSELPSSVLPGPQFLRLRRWLTALGAGFFALGVVPPFWTEALLARLGWHETAFSVLLFRLHCLGFLLLGINLLCARSSTDESPLRGYAQASALLLGSWGLLAAGFRGPWWLAALALVGVLGALGMDQRVKRQRRGRPKRTGHTWPFTFPLAFSASLTLVMGLAIAVVAPWLDHWLGVEPQPEHRFWIWAFACNLLTNTLSMAGARFTRDLRLVRAQLSGSLIQDSLAGVLLLHAVITSVLAPWAVLLAFPYFSIAAWCWRLLGRIRSLQALDVQRPRSYTEVAWWIRRTSHEHKLLRVLGSSHSLARSIHADEAPAPRPARASEACNTHLSLELLDQVVSVDRPRRRITVQAGMHLGQNPEAPSSVDNNLLLHLNELGWALPNLGGIAQQTVAGFIAMGCAGGSTRYAFSDAVRELRFLDAQGKMHVVRKDGDATAFNAALVSLGLFGVVVEVTFECEPRYWVEGREVSAVVADGKLRLPSSEASNGQPRAAERVIDLRGAGDDSLGAYLRATEYCRILWWPQPGVSQMVVWEAGRTSRPGSRPYRAEGGLAQWFGGLALTLVGTSFGRGIRRILGQRLRAWLLPFVIKRFLPRPARTFHAPWHVNLPMDTHVDDALVPTEFTELWFPLEHTGEVMRELIAMYEDPEVAGTFACELYAGKASDAWLSPAYGGDVFRVDLFWFQRNLGDPARDYYPQFWRRLAPFDFRAHWAKHLPEPNSAQGVDYRRSRFPRWHEFLQKREEYDPRGTFLSRYWQRHLGLTSIAVQSLEQLGTSGVRTRPGAEPLAADQAEG